MSLKFLEKCVYLYMSGLGDIKMALFWEAVTQAYFGKDAASFLYMTKQNKNIEQHE